MSMKSWIRMLKEGDAEQIGNAAKALGDLGSRAVAAVSTLAQTLAITDVRAPDEWYEQWDDSPMGQSGRAEPIGGAAPAGRGCTEADFSRAAVWTI